MNPVDLANQIAALESWWVTLPAEERRTCYRPQEIAASAGVSVTALSTALPVLGWHCAQRWTRESGQRKLRTYFAPPGQHVPKVPRGRPSTQAILAPLFDLPDPYNLYPR